MVFDLAGIRSADDAAAFAAKYGQLWVRQPEGEIQREPVSRWMESAGASALLIDLYIYFNKALAGDQVSQDLLKEINRDRMSEAPDPGVPEDLNDATLEQLAYRYRMDRIDDLDSAYGEMSQLIAALLNAGQAGIKPVVVTTMNLDAGERMYGWWRVMSAPSLLGSIYDVLTDLIQDNREMRHCEECGRSFLMTDPRRLYCSETCASRVRRRRWRERQQGSVTGSQEQPGRVGATIRCNGESADAVDAGKSPD